MAALLAAIGVLAIASARPELTRDVPAQKTSIILALDESGSMCSTDLLPDRLAVAQRGALQFVNSEPSGTQIGLVLFNVFAELAVPPTTDRGALDHALDHLTTGPGTAIGAAILQSLDAIAQVDPQVKPVANSVLGAEATPSQLGGASVSGSSTSGTTGTAAKPGSEGYVPDIIVLLTDGANNRGITPLQAAPYAVARRVRIYTIGYGTTHPGPLECTPQQQGGFSGGGGGFGGGGFGGGGFGGGGFGGGGFGGGSGQPTGGRPASAERGLAADRRQELHRQNRLAALAGVRQPVQGGEGPKGARRGDGRVRHHRGVAGPGGVRGVHPLGCPPLVSQTLIEKRSSVPR